MSQSFEQQLNDIEQRVIKLVELNAHYRRVCSDLLEVKRKMENENKLLHETVKEQGLFIQELEIQLQSLSQQQQVAQQVTEEEQPVVATNSDTPSAIDNSALIQQIDQHIAQLDKVIEWLSEVS